jgi:hypothetical protein
VAFLVRLESPVGPRVAPADDGASFFPKGWTARVSQAQPTAAEPEEPEPQGNPFAAGFCGPHDDEGTISLRLTLRGQVRDELNRRIAAMTPEEVDAMMRALDPFIHTGAVPDGVNASNLLMHATLKPDVPPARLLGLADQLIATRQADAYVLVARASAAQLLNKPDVELEAVRAARQALPRDPAVGWALADLLRNTAELDEAIAGLDSYLAADPLPSLTRMRARLIVARDIQRDYRRRTREGVTVLWPPDVLTDTQADAALGAVIDALEGVARLIGAVRRPALTAVIYPGQSEMFAVTCIPNWAGAVYDGTLRLVASPAQVAGVDLEQLRHETTHAQLTPVLPESPHWFQEGLAQVYANPSSRPPAAWAMMVVNRTWIPFESLDGSFHIFDKSRDADLAYTESRALVELMQARGGPNAIARAVQTFKEGEKTMGVLARVTGQREVTGEDLLRYIGQRLTAAGR